MSETKEVFESSTNAGKLLITRTIVSGTSTTINTDEHDKYQYMSNLSTEKARNLTQITTLQARNIKIDTLIAEVNALA
jgi:hypothetical protein